MGHVCPLVRRSPGAPFLVVPLDGRTGRLGVGVCAVPRLPGSLGTVDATPCKLLGTFW